MVQSRQGVHNEIANELLPTSATQGSPEIIQTRQPSYTYNVEFEADEQINGFTDGLKAMKLAIFKILSTERYRYPIYSWNYGIELEDLFGQPIPYVYAELQRRITEALEADDRIISVTGFEFSHDDGDVFARFDVETIFGTIENITKGVSV